MQNCFGKNLRFIRKQSGKTLESLALELKISKSAISDYETGKTFPSLDVTELLSNYFKLSIDALKNNDLSVLNEEELKNLKGQFSVSNNKDDYSEKVNQLGFQNQMLQQKLDGLNLQLQLINQVVQSKDAELRSLKVQIKLLEEKYEVNL